MKKAGLILIFGFINSIVFSQQISFRQTLIPLDNVKGVPFSFDNEIKDYYAPGFEVDKKGDFYFLGGDYKSNSFTIFHGDKQVFRKVYNEDPSDGKLHFFNNKLYTYNSVKNDLIELNPVNGTIIKTVKHISSKHFNRHLFTDSSITGELLGNPDLTYEQYNFAGKLIGKPVNEYNISPSIMPDANHHTQLLGSYDNNYVFYSLGEENKKAVQKFWLVTKKGKVLATKTVPDDSKIWGNVFIENAQENRIIRNGNLYILGRKGKNALILEIGLAKLFKS